MLPVAVLVGCSSANASPPAWEFLGEQHFAPGYTSAGTTVGGLSGISFDPVTQVYYVVSDDRSEHNPARFYTVRIDVGGPDVAFAAVHDWLRPDGQVFAPLDFEAPVVPPDPEGIAFDSRRQVLYWSSEGERITDGPSLDPWVRIATLDGAYVGEFEPPPDWGMSVDGHGPRRNLGPEGLALSPDGSTLFAGLEEPTYDDAALTRVTAFDIVTRKPFAQYGYQLDAPSAGEGATNGLSEVLALDSRTLLILERGYGTHVAARIYRVEIGGATNILGSGSDGAVPMTKTLVADLTGMVRPLDNVEGMTLGPTLPDGRQSVILVSDDNFNPDQITQFLLFAM